jgi:hypothetical protein
LTSDAYSWTYSCPDRSPIARITSSAIVRRAFAGGSPARWPNSSGLPILISILVGRGTGAPGGSIFLVPSIATGRTGAVVFIASQPSPARPRYSRPSGDLVPSG